MKPGRAARGPQIGLRASGEGSRGELCAQATGGLGRVKSQVGQSGGLREACQGLPPWLGVRGGFSGLRLRRPGHCRARRDCPGNSPCRRGPSRVMSEKGVRDGRQAARQVQERSQQRR